MYLENTKFVRLITFENLYELLLMYYDQLVRETLGISRKSCIIKNPHEN